MLDRRAVRTWYRKCATRGPWWALKWTALVGSYRLRQSLGPLASGETNVYDRAWDLLIVLDACRFDALANVSIEYDWLDEVTSVISTGSSSAEWLQATFGTDRHAEAVADTVYITGNPHSAIAIDHHRLARVDEVWRTAWDDDLGTIPPRPLTDRAIAAMRAGDSERCVVHYMQPHFPALSTDLGGAIDPSAVGQAHADSIWLAVRRGEVSVAAVREAYLDNLRAVLADVQLLIENVDAPRTVITADHGNAFGEWGFYGHHGYTPLRSMREVPWCELTAVDRGTHDPADHGDDTVATAKDRLAGLGYV